MIVKEECPAESNELILSYEIHPDRLCSAGLRSFHAFKVAS